MRRFGETRNFAQGEVIVTAGQVTQDLSSSFPVRPTSSGAKSLRKSIIVTQGRSEFMGELAQLAGRPALADAIAKKPVRALIIAPERLRALLTAEAELGERIMRALNSPPRRSA